MSWSWYGVKSIYETTVAPPTSPDEREVQRPAERLVEERVVLVKARNIDEALAKAEAEANRYAGGTRYRNHEGDLVQTKYLGALDAFSIDGELASGKEVYSSHRIVPGALAEQELLDMLLGPRGGYEEEARRKYEPDSPIE